MYFIETGYGEQFDNPTPEIIKMLVSKLALMDEEHGSFWMVDEEENVIQLDKDLTVLIEPPNHEKPINFKIKSNEAAVVLFTRFLNGEVNQIQKEYNRK